MQENSIRIKERTIHYDGDSSVHDIEFLYNKILKGEDLDNIFVEEITPEIKKYNSLSGTSHPLKIKQEVKSMISSNWNIPKEYSQLNLRKYILLKLEIELNNNKFSDEEIAQRLNRVEIELDLWKTHQMNMLLATLIYIVDTLEANSMVWGTGRGSSCCCYILYLIGLHDVDSIYYNLDIGEFFKNLQNSEHK